MRLLVISFSVALFAYAAISLRLGLGQPNVDAPKWCAAWLCPEEFGHEKVVRLIREARERGNQTAIKDLQRAVELDSASAFAWANLGDGLANANQMDKAEYCFERARAAGPRSPIILLRAANFEFASGNNGQVMTDLLPILRDGELTEYYDPVFLTYLRTGLPMERVLEEGMPPVKPAGQALLRYVMANGSVADSEKVWKWTFENALSDDRLTGEYVEFLTQQKQATAAVETWAEVNRGADVHFRRTNWVYNGDFGQAPKPALFDWKLEGSDDVAVERGKDGGIKLKFAGKENVDFHGVSQELVLDPGKWVAKATVKAQGVTTDEGVRLRVWGEGLDVMTEPMKGTIDWIVVPLEFVTGGKEAGVVRLEIERRASRKFDNKLAGVVWVNSVEVVRVPQSLCRGRNQINSGRSAPEASRIGSCGPNS